MKFKTLIRVAMIIAIAASVFGAGTQVYAQSSGAQIIIRSTTFWDAVFNGTVNATRYERWSLKLEQAANFTVTVNTTTGDLVPTIILMDASENQIASAIGSGASALLTTSQPAGDYFIQIQPQSGGGTYSMEIRPVVPVLDPTAVVMLNPASVLIGETATGSVVLNNIPQGGYASAEFTCTYDPALVSISNITDGGLFGTDPAVAIFGPANGSFIFAVAGSNDQRATNDGTVFTFSVTALAAGQANIVCVARVSAGGELVTIQSTSASLLITVPTGTLNGTVLAAKPVTVTLTGTGVADSTLVDANGNFSFTAPAGTYTVVASAPGYLEAQGSPVITAGVTTIMPTISLLAGDIDGNDVIDQFDALTIGMNYNLAAPAAADLNNDGTINVLDLELLAANYRATGPTVWQ